MSRLDGSVGKHVIGDVGTSMKLLPWLARTAAEAGTNIETCHLENATFQFGPQAGQRAQHRTFHIVRVSCSNPNGAK